MKNQRKLVAISLLFWGASACLTFADNVEATPTEKRATPGLIFNANNLLLDLSSYQGGIGMILKRPQDAWRFSIGFGYESGSNEINTSLGLSYIRPFFMHKVMPYWGCDLAGEYSYNKNQIDSENWQKTNGYMVGVSALLGVEFLLDPRVSLFAEYSLGVDISWVTEEESVLGVTDKSASHNFSTGTDLGNSGSIGVIIYLEE